MGVPFGRSVVRSDLDKLLTFGSVQMNLHCTHLIAVLQSVRTEYKYFQYTFFGLKILILTASGLQIPTNISPNAHSLNGYVDVTNNTNWRI